MNQTNFFRNKVAIITGGSTGIGKSIAEKLASEQCNLGVIGKDKEKLNALKKELNKYRVVINTYPCDVSQNEEVKKTAQQIKKDFKTINFLVNNAGQSI